MRKNWEVGSWTRPEQLCIKNKFPERTLKHGVDSNTHKVTSSFSSALKHGIYRSNFRNCVNISPFHINCLFRKHKESFYTIVSVEYLAKFVVLTLVFVFMPKV